MDLRAELRAFLANSEVTLPDGFDDDTPLLSSGTLDSLALFNLLLWIEEKTGRSVDPTQVDIVRSWDTVRRIVDHIEGSADPAAADLASAPLATCAGGVRIVPYGPEHEDAVARLQTGLWSPDVELNRRYRAWEHDENPLADRSRLYLALHGDDLIGMRSFYGSRWEVGRPTREVDLLVADDLIVRKDHRDEGIVSAIMRAAFEDLSAQGERYVLNLSGGPVTVLASLAMGWRSAGSLQAVGVGSRAQRVRVGVRERMGSIPFVWRYAGSHRLRAGIEHDPLTRFDAHLGAVHRGEVEIELSDTPRIAEMAALIEEQDHDGRLRHVRDAAFLSWRFRNPLNHYRFVYAGAGALAGYLVLKWSRVRRRPNPRVQLVDLEARDERVGRALLETAIRVGRFPELVTWRAALPGFAGEALDRLGFLAVDPERARHGLPCVLVRPVDDTRVDDEWTLHGARLLDPSSWDMRMLYTMAG